MSFKLRSRSSTPCLGLTATDGDSGDHGRRSSPVDVAPLTAASYLDPHYWDERFAVEGHYEWFKDYSHFQHLIRPFLNPSHSIGCGNSRLCEELRKDGAADMTCVDISPVAVERMRSRFRDKGLEGIKTVQADMLDLPFDSESFDMVIEKGTMNIQCLRSHACLYLTRCGHMVDFWKECAKDTYVIASIQKIQKLLSDPWNNHPETLNKVMKMLEGVHSVLKPEGIFIPISFGQPHFWRPVFERSGFTWSVEWKTFGEGFHYFFYIPKKGRRTLKSDDCKNERSSVPSINLLHEELEDEDYMPPYAMSLRSKEANYDHLFVLNDLF